MHSDKVERFFETQCRWKCNRFKADVDSGLCIWGLSNRTGKTSFFYREGLFLIFIYLFIFWGGGLVNIEDQTRKITIHKPTEHPMRNIFFVE